MALSPYGQTLASGARALVDTETYTVPTRGRKGLVLVTDVTAIGNGQSFVEGATITLPVVIDATHKSFNYNAIVYTIALATYSTLADLATAIGAATAASATPFSTVVTTSVVGDHLRFTSVPTGVNAQVFAVGTTNDVLTTATGLTTTWTIARTSAAGADGAFSQTISVLGVDDASGKTWTILAAAAQSTVSTKVLQVHPQMADSANLVAAALLPSSIVVSITHTTNNSVTRTHGISLVS